MLILYVLIYLIILIKIDFWIVMIFVFIFNECFVINFLGFEILLFLLIIKWIGNIFIILVLGILFLFWIFFKIDLICVLLILVFL